MASKRAVVVRNPEHPTRALLTAMDRHSRPVFRKELRRLGLPGERLAKMSTLAMARRLVDLKGGVA